MRLITFYRIVSLSSGIYSMSGRRFWLTIFNMRSVFF